MYTFVVVLYAMSTLIMQLMIHSWEGVTCDTEISRWSFDKCTSFTVIYLFHAVSNMQAAALVRAIFVKESRQAAETTEVQFGA